MAGRVAVVMPCYNAERWVGATLETLMKQNYDNFVVFAVNDGSSDRSEIILRIFLRVIRTRCASYRRQTRAVVRL